MREPVQSSEQPRDHGDEALVGNARDARSTAEGSSSHGAEELERALEIRRREERGEVL